MPVEIDQGFQPWLSSQPTSVLDLCAGSGCIGIACAMHLGSQVDLVELSPEALALAEQNIRMQIQKVEHKMCPQRLEHLE